jgi:hypothetical protein
MAAHALSAESAMEKFGTDDIEREQDRLDTEFAVMHPDMQLGKALLALTRRRHPLLPFLREAAQMNKAGGQPGAPGQPGLPSISGGPPGGLPHAERGMPPNMAMPPGL